VTTAVGRLLEAAQRQNKMESLRQDVEQTLQKLPDWSAGKAMLALLLVRRGKTEEGRKLVLQLLEDKKNPIPLQARWCMAQELEGYGGTLDLALRLHEEGLEEALTDQNTDLSYSPARRILTLYQRAGRNADARAVALRFARADVGNDYDPGYSAYRKINNRNAVADILLGLGYPVDAGRLYNDLLNDTEAMEAAARWGERMEGQGQAGLQSSLKSLKGDTLPDALRGLLKPAEKPMPGTPLVDPVLLLPSRELKQAAIVSMLQLTLKAAAANPELLTEAKTLLADLQKQSQQDLSVPVAAALLALAEGKAEAVTEAVDRLARRVEETPLEALPPGTRANARQRAQAALQLGLWVVARACYPKDELRATATKLGTRAIEAARRQKDQMMALAMLREWGQLDLERGDRKAAEQRWTQMLEMVLPASATQQGAKKEEPTTAPAAPPPVPKKAEGDGGSPEVKVDGWPGLRGISARRASEGGLISARRASEGPASLARRAEMDSASATLPDGSSEPSYGSNINARIIAGLGPILLICQVAVPPAPSSSAMPATVKDAKLPVAGSAVTVEQFQKAIEVARLAAEQGVPSLSLRAVRDSLRAGPPVEVPRSNEQVVASGRPSITTNDNSGTFTTVESTLGELDLVWRKQKLPAADVYQVLAGVVLPSTRPAEIFFYPRNLNNNELRLPYSVGRMLAHWAVQAGKGDDLRQRVEARQAQPLAEIPAHVLLAQLALAGKDDKALAEQLQWFEQRLQKDLLENTAVLACHAALPALEEPRTSKLALPVLDRAARNLAGLGNDDTGSSLMLVLARHHLENKRLDEGKKLLAEYQRLLLVSAVRNGGGEGQNYEQFQNVAAEYVRAGLTDDALELFGKYVDALALFRDQNNGGGPPSFSAGPLAASFYRQLAARPAQDRYNALKPWTMPTENRKSIRLIAAFVPQDAPPAAFGTFPPRPHGGVLSSAGALIEAAKEAGKLDELASELDEAVKKNLKDATALAVLVQVARGQEAAAEPAVKELLEALTKPEEPQTGRRYYYEGPKPVSWSDYLVCRAALASPKLHEQGVKIAEQLLTRAQQQQDQNFIPHLHHDLAASRFTKAGGKEIAAGPNLALWQPVVHESAASHQLGTLPAWWVEHEGHISHLIGPEQDFLTFAYPLTGTFELSVDLSSGGWGEGGASYGGLVYEPFVNGAGSTVSAVGGGDIVQVTTFVSAMNGFNRLTFEVAPDRVRCLVNGRLFYEDKTPSPTSPWLSLVTRRERQPVWRSLTLKGKPEIPREVALSHADRLEGWVSSFFGESQPTRRSTPEEMTLQQRRMGGYYRGKMFIPNSAVSGQQLKPEDHDWYAKDGVIHGRRDESYVPRDPQQSRLFYQRPLHNGETLRYEFWYEPGTVMVHPALDRLTFLLDPDGVRLHWMTDSPDQEWTGLKADNIVEEPATRRGNGPLPLKAGEWNAVKLTLAGDTVSVELNGVKVAERKLEPENNHLFGFFHYKDRTSVRVRQVVLSGDWPKELSAEQVANLLAPSARLPAAEQRACGALIDESNFSQAATDILKQARALPAADRYALLSAWVLPTETRPAFRLYADFTPMDSLPVTGEKLPPGKRVHTGGALEAPALELVATAKELGKLDELAERVAKAPAAAEAQERGQKALLALVRAAQGRDDEAAELLKQLRPLLAKVTREEPLWGRWPEQLAAAATMERPKLHDAALALLDHIVVEQLNKADPKNPPPIDSRVRHLRARGQVLALPEALRRPFGSDPSLAHWAPVMPSGAGVGGTGSPPAHWLVQDGTLTHYPGFGSDFLYFGVPLRGDFEIECELSSFGWRESHLMYGTQWINLHWEKKAYEVYGLGQQMRSLTLDPPLQDPGDWYKYRLVVRDGGYEVYVNGRKIHDEALPPLPDPWLAIHVPSQNTGGVRNLQIKGSPIIPDKLELSAMPELTGWSAEGFGEMLGGDNASWQRRGEEIYATRNVGEEGPTRKVQSMLQYHRPLLEDGDVEYEFWYEPGKVMVHPALDRLALLLAPDGVKVHWVTYQGVDQPGLEPDNATVEAANRRGPEKLPLKVREWNRVKLSLVGDRIVVKLNDVEVYQRDLESTNQRTFGLFRFQDETEVRVRNVVYRGNWAKRLPASNELFAPAK
jgi:hypothetical protein